MDFVVSFHDATLTEIQEILGALVKHPELSIPSAAVIPSVPAAAVQVPIASPKKPAGPEKKKRVMIPWSDKDLELIKPAISRKDAVKRYLKEFPGSPRDPKNIGDMWSYLKKKAKLAEVTEKIKIRLSPGDQVKYDHKYNPVFHRMTGRIIKIDGKKCLVNFGQPGESWVGLGHCAKIDSYTPPKAAAAAAGGS